MAGTFSNARAIGTLSRGVAEEAAMPPKAQLAAT